MKHRNQLLCCVTLLLVAVTGQQALAGDLKVPVLNFRQQDNSQQPYNYGNSSGVDTVSGSSANYTAPPPPLGTGYAHGGSSSLPNIFTPGARLLFTGKETVALTIRDVRGDWVIADPSGSQSSVWLHPASMDGFWSVIQ